VNKNIFTMSFRERRRFRIDELPRDLHEALDMLEKGRCHPRRAGLAHLRALRPRAKREEWQEYIGQVSEWELDKILGTVLKA